MAVFNFGDYTVDDNNFTLVRGDEQVAISPRAFDVLALLVRNAGRVVEKQTLFDEIWKDTFVTDDALIRAVREIRSLLGDDPASPRYIETVRKRGYRFIGELGTGQPVQAEQEKVSQDISEGQNELTDRAESAPSAFTFLRRPYIYLVAASFFVIVAAVSASLYWGTTRREQIRTLAVMPIEGASSEMGHLADGLTEYLIDTISRDTSIEVKASSTVFRFKGQRYDPVEIRDQLSVDAVVTGRLIQRDSEYMLLLSLADGRTNNHLWSGQYAINESNILGLQRSVASDLGEFLVWGRNGKKASSDELTANNEAYSAYLKGRYHFLSTAARADEIATEYFRRAIDLDPEFALAWAGLAEVATASAFRSEVPSIDAFVPARQNAMRSLELDAGLAEAQIAVANIKLWHEWDLPGAEQHLKRAIELEPRNEEAHFLLAVLYSVKGNWKDGKTSFGVSKRFDPLNLRNNAVFAQFLTFNNEAVNSVEESRRILELDPGFYLAHLTLSQAFHELGRYEDALASATRAAEMNQKDSTPIVFTVLANWRLGRAEAARSTMQNLLDRSGREPVSPYNIAMIFAGIGDEENAIAWLRRAKEQRDLRLVFLASDPKWRPLAENAEFVKIREAVIASSQ